MSETATLETPAQAVAEPTPVTAPAAVEAVTPAPVAAGETVTEAQALEAIFEARTTGNNKEADRLTGLLEAAHKAPAIAEPVAAEPVVAEVEPPAAEPEPEAEPPAVEPVAADEKEPNRLRITHLSESDKSDQIAIHALTKKGVPLAEAMQRILGPLPTAQAPSITLPDIPASEMATPELKNNSIEELESTVSYLEGQLDEVAENSGLYGSDAARLTKELIRANAKLESARVKSTLAEQIAAREDAEFVSQRSANEATAMKQYKALSDDKSPLFQLWYELSVAAHSPNHPDHEKALSVDGPSHFAAKAAKLLGIQPDSTKPASPVVPAPPAAQPPPATRPAAATKGSMPPPPAKTSADVAREAEAAFESASTGNLNSARRPQGGMIIR